MKVASRFAFAVAVAITIGRVDATAAQRAVAVIAEVEAERDPALAAFAN